jgi:Asp-tRNA(Asn)/Glu-tRNA(Gln) amidotransferase A subunit family amidase
VKDLLDTKDIPTTYGAEPFRNRVPSADSAVVRRLNDAGAVLIAKLSLGALALNDIWFGGQTMNPWLLEEGASGSSAGPGAATAAGLVGFSIGSETGGSIVSPAMRCGVTGLRPTFGRVARTGAMTLCWSLDKLGPMTRSVEDAMLVLQAISGPDAGDPSSVPSRLSFDASAPISGLKVGYLPKWMQESPATDVDRSAMETMRKLGLVLKEVTLPDWPYSSLMPVLFAEGAASFEELATNNQLGALKVQVKDAWPNLFRQARFLSAIDMVQADRLRRKVALEMARVFRDIDVLLVPSLRDEQLTISNFTGHPSLTLRAGFVTVGQARSDWAPDPANPLPTFNPPRRVPHGITILGRLFDDGLIGQVGSGAGTSVWCRRRESGRLLTWSAIGHDRFLRQLESRFSRHQGRRHQVRLRAAGDLAGPAAAADRGGPGPDAHSGGQRRGGHRHRGRRALRRRAASAADAEHGFLAAINGIVSLAQLYGLPLCMLIALRGHWGEPYPWHTRGGIVTEPVLRALGIPFEYARDPATVGRQIREAWTFSQSSQSPVALLLTRDLMED